MLLTVFGIVLMMLAYMATGFLLCKGQKAFVAHAKSLSGVLIYIMNPCMIVNAFLQLEYSRESLVKMGKYFVVSFFVQLLFLAFLFLIFRKKCTDAKYRVLCAGGVLGNVGFMGMPLIASVFPNEPIVLCYSSINVVTMNLIVFTFGVYLLTNDKKYVTLKNAIINPTTLPFFVALPLFFFNVQLPDAVGNAVSILAKAVTPMCMIILGMRLSASNFRQLFTRPFVYATAAFKLLVFPLFSFALVRFLPFLDPVAKSTVVILTTVPSAAVIQSLAEMHDSEQELAANVVLLTTLISVITIPLVVALLISA